MTNCRLVAIEWEDSAQPIPAWSYLADYTSNGIVRCMSVGWLIQDDENIKALAPNMGAIDDESRLQISGVIHIPTRCVVRISDLKEPLPIGAKRDALHANQRRNAAPSQPSRRAKSQEAA